MQKQNNVEIACHANQRGITLIALIITIIVLLILAGVTINLTIGENGIFKTAQQAAKNYTNAQEKELADLAEFNNTLNDTIKGDEKVQLVTEIKLNKTVTTITVGTTGTLTATINPDNASNKSLTWTSSNTDVATVSDGTITAVALGATTITATAKDGSGKSASCNVTVAEAGVAFVNNTNANRTIDGQTATYQNPIIPVGFSAINTDVATWNSENGASSQWNNGLVIKNTTDGNEFVWVPVDVTSVPYARWCTTNISYANCSDIASTSGLNLANNVTSYGGFWVARYEAGVGSTSGNTTGVPVSKAEATVWNNIDWNNAKASAEKMYANNYVQSGLVNGTQWDTIMKWVNNGGQSVTSSGSWGNYNNGSSPKTAGSSNTYRAKNIYDLAGNVWEWTDESYSIGLVFRGGGYDYDGSIFPAACRNGNSATFTYSSVGFRVQLYIK